MDSLGLFVDFIDDLNRTNAIGKSRADSSISGHNNLGALLSSSSHRLDITTQSVNPAGMQPPQPQHPSTSAPSSAVHAPSYMGSSSTSRTWVDPIDHAASEMGFKHSFATHPSHPPYQSNADQRAPMPLQYTSAYDNVHQQYQSGHLTPPWTAYQAFAYARPDDRFLQHTNHLLGHSGQPAPQLRGGPPVGLGFPYHSQCRDSSCQCHYFQAPSSYVDSDAAMVAKEGWNANGAAY